MNLPGFTAEVSLYRNRGDYGRNAESAGSRAGTVVPAIPFCGNCDFILENCARNGGKPRAVCRACEIGNCFSGVENPPPPPPGQWNPRWW